MRVLLNVDALTFDDHIDFEAETGSAINEALARMIEQRATVVQQRALIWVFTRMVVPWFSLEDAGAIRVGEVEWEVPQSTTEDGEDA